MKTRKTALVTGGTSGVGLSVVRSLIRQNYHVVFIGTNEKKGDALASEFNATLPDQAEFVCLDLSNLVKVKAFTDDFLNRYSRLDFLANIAGVILPKREITAEGFEKTFATGYLSAFILCIQLEPLLKATEGSRIINVSAQSKIMLAESLDFDNLDFSKDYNGFKTSIATVHAKTVLTNILSEKFGYISVNSFDPGIVKSRLTRHMPLPFRLLTALFTLFMPENSKTGVYVCTFNRLRSITGKLFSDQKPISLNFTTAYKDKLWLATNEMLKAILN